MQFATADLVDRNQASIVSCSVPFLQFGGRSHFYGPVRTAQTLDDNALIRDLVSTPGDGAVLVVDGGGSLATALAGDMLAEEAIRNAWAGLVLFGAVRDSVRLRSLNLGIKALGTNPMRSAKLGTGTLDLPIRFGGITFTPGHWLYSDEDGIILSSRRLPL